MTMVSSLLKNVFGVLRKSPDERNYFETAENNPRMLNSSKHCGAFFNDLLAVGRYSRPNSMARCGTAAMAMAACAGMRHP
jgi:hypothetical protein